MLSEIIKINDSLASELRKRFLCQLSIYNEEFDGKDINNIRNNDIILKRYLQFKNLNVEESLKMLENAMKWRKQFDVNQLNESSFPREYFQMGCIFTYGQDLNGAQTIIFRIKANKKINEWTQLLKKFFVFLIEKESIRFENNENKGICIVFDCNGAGISNVDIDLLFFIIQTLRDYYPMLVTSAVINELPWLLQYLFNLGKSWIPKDYQNLLHLVSKKDINLFIAESELPDFMGGTNQNSYRNCLKNVPTAQELAQRKGIKQKELEKLLKHLEAYLKVN